MPQLNQKGVIQLAVVFILLAGIAATVYLVNRGEPLKWFPRALERRSLSGPISGPVCIQVVTAAKNSATGECREFPTPCDVPAGWKKVDSCGPMPTTRPSPIPVPLSCNACNADINKDGIVNNYDIVKISSCISGKAKGSACLNMDFNGNGKVDQEDLKCVRSVYNQKCTKPKPRPTEMSIF